MSQKGMNGLGLTPPITVLQNDARFVLEHTSHRYVGSVTPSFRPVVFLHRNVAFYVYTFPIPMPERSALRSLHSNCSMLPHLAPVLSIGCSTME